MGHSDNAIDGSSSNSRLNAAREKESLSLHHCGRGSQFDSSRVNPVDFCAAAFRPARAGLTAAPQQHVLHDLHAADLSVLVSCPAQHSTLRLHTHSTRARALSHQDALHVFLGSSTTMCACVDVMVM